ncbi:AAA family ATPase [Flavobacterium alkalisoli]|uniref:AAA family ATPase n=1 Tax=Flavobacterium alkalisoli TaxID=2602769 RepID=UPI003A91D428
MSDTILKDQIITWVENQPYWFQYLSITILNGNEISNEILDETLRYFLQDHSLIVKGEERQVLNFNKISDFENSHDNDLYLKSIKDIKNVNALAVGQSIEIHPNLTIIYGANGTGKSGYVRMLNTAFKSRGDKNIIKNVFKEDEGEPSCTFEFSDSQQVYDLYYPSDANKNEFDKYSVFDSQSIKVHLENNNKLNFTPSGFEYFESMVNAFEALKIKFDDIINKSSPINSYKLAFQNDNEIKLFVESLNSKTKKEELKVLSKFDESDVQKLEGLKSKREYLKSLNIAEKINELKEHKFRVNKLRTDLIRYNNILGEDTIANIHKLFIDREALQLVLNKEGIDALKDYPIQHLESKEWRSFIENAKDYFDILESKDVNSCIFCLQSLSNKEQELIDKYWKIISSQTKQEIQDINVKIDEYNKAIQILPSIVFDKDSILYNYLIAIHPKFVEKYTIINVNYRDVIEQIQKNILNKIWLPVSSIVVDLIDFDLINKNIDHNIEELQKKDPVKEIENLDKQIYYYTDKFTLNKMADSIEKDIDKWIWADKASKLASSFNTRILTLKQGELFTGHISEKYMQVFKEECKKLKAPNFVEISQKNVKSNTLRSLKISGHTASSILSEGEQRAISLADFMTETLLNPYKRGVIFDDPVTSLDHQRRELIADRIVEFALEHQVIVFTHDIPFYIKLKTSAVLKGVDFIYKTIRNVSGTPGVIDDSIPWIAQDVKARLGVLKNELVKIKKIVKEGDTDSHEFAVKKFYGLMREGWERAVEERLLKGVVERFNIGVSTQKLRKLEITKELLDDIDKGMTDCSKFVHDSATELNPPIPEVDDIEKDLSFFESFIKKCLPA